MIDQLNQDIKEAMKAGEKDRLQALRYLKSMLIENKTSKAPIAELDVAIKHVKKLKDSVETYPADNPMRGKILDEIRYLGPYLPQPLSEAEVRSIIQTIIDGLENAQMGAVMKELSPQIKGKFDGKRANELVKELLGI
jgi:uncharacterized protein